eukprot:14598970-Ditylum_brightwellii.AAC.1
MSITEYVGEDISTVMGFIYGMHTILDNCDFLPPNFMQILFEVFVTAPDDEFIKHVSTIGPYEQRDCYNCGEKGGISKSHISPGCPHPCKPHNVAYGRGQGCGGGQRQGRGRGCKGRGSPQQQQQKPVYPKAREPHVHTVKGITEHWCGRCMMLRGHPIWNSCSRLVPE